MNTRSRRSRSGYTAVALIGGAAFGIVALLHAPGIFYVIVAVVLGLGYSLVGRIRG